MFLHDWCIFLNNPKLTWVESTVLFIHQTLAQVEGWGSETRDGAKQYSPVRMHMQQVNWGYLAT